MSILRIREVKAETGKKSNGTVYSDVRDGLFPKPVQIGKRSVGWPDYEVRAICMARIAGMSNSDIRVLVHQLHERRVEQLDRVLADFQTR